MTFRFRVNDASRLRLSSGTTILLDGEIEAGSIKPGAVAATEDGLEVRITSVALVNRPRAAGDAGLTLRIDEPAFPIESLVGKTLAG